MEILQFMNLSHPLKDVLLNYPEARQKWFDFEYEWMKKQAIEFLDETFMSRKES